MRSVQSVCIGLLLALQCWVVFSTGTARYALLVDQEEEKETVGTLTYLLDTTLKSSRVPYTGVWSTSSQDQQSRAKMLSDAAKSADRVLVFGYRFLDVLLQVASQHVKTLFLLVDSKLRDPLSPSNVLPVVESDNFQMGYLAGLLATNVAQNQTHAGELRIGALGIQDSLQSGAYLRGFHSGVRSACSENIRCRVVCGFVKAEQVQEAQEAAGHFHSHHIKVLVHAAGTAGNAAIQLFAASSEDHFVVGKTTDEWVTLFAGGNVPGSERIVTSMVVRLDQWLAGFLKSSNDMLTSMNGTPSRAAVEFAPCHETCNKVDSSTWSGLREQGRTEVERLRSDSALDSGNLLETGCEGDIMDLRYRMQLSEGSVSPMTLLSITLSLVASLSLL